MINAVNVVEVFKNNTKVGRLALTPESLCAFEYDTEYLYNGVSLSPFYLPLQSGVFLARREPFNGLFGVFNDSLPDGWGTLLTDRMLLKNGYNLSEVNVLNRLCLIGNNGMGALSFKPEWVLTKSSEIADLNVLAQEAAQIINSNYDGNLEELYIKAGSSGGARPKVLISINNEDWLVKFKSSSDPENIGQIEYEYSLAAKKCGIEMPETRLFEGKYFGVRRFDKVGNQRYHVHSASGLLYASFRYPSLDYTELVKAALALTKNVEEAYKIFRFMVFNVLTKNRDDHAKNFSFILKANTWVVSPAYDMVLSQGFNGQHTTTISGNGNPDFDDIIKVAKSTGLSEKKAITIYDEVFENSKQLKKHFPKS